MNLVYKIMIPMSVALIFNACGGGSSSTGGTTMQSTSLSGTAAAGAPIIGNVIAKGSAGKTISQAIEANGNYNIDVSSLTAPYMLRATGTVGGRSYDLFSFAESSDIGNTVNITPFTDLIIANAANQLASAYFTSGDFSTMTTDTLKVEEAALQAKLQTVLTSLGVADTIDLLHTSFSANHTDIDAALDMVRVDVNATSNIATITNLIDSTSIQDGIVDDTLDDSTPLVVTTDLATIEADYAAIANTFSAFDALFATALPSAAQLDPFFSSTFLDDDQGKSQIITLLSTQKNFVGLSLSNPVITDLNQTAGTALVSFTISYNKTSAQNDEVLWRMEKVNNQWLLSGNRQIVDTYLGFQCENVQNALGSTWKSCGINLNVEDLDATNNNGAGAIRSAKVTLMRNGADVTPALTIYLGDDNSVGELYIYDQDYNDDYLGFFTDSTVLFDPSVIHDGDMARFDIYDTPLDLTNPAAPSVTGTPVATYYMNIPKAPVTQAEMLAHSYPTIADATKTAIQNFTSGNITLSWTLPSDLLNEEAAVWMWDNVSSNQTNVSEWIPTSNSVTLTLDPAASGLTMPYNYDVRIYSSDVYGRTFTASYRNF